MRHSLRSLRRPLQAGPSWTRIGLSRALVLSALCHLGLLAAASGIVALVASGRDSLLPRRLEFFFAPEEKPQSRLQEDASSRSLPAPAAAVPDIPLSPEREEIPEVPRRDIVSLTGVAQPLQQTSLHSEAPLTSRERGPSLSAASSSPNYLDVEHRPSSLRSTFQFDERLLKALRESPVFDEGLRLSPAALSIPVPVRRKLQKRVFRLMKKLPRVIRRDTLLTWEEAGESYRARFEVIEPTTDTDLEELEVTVEKQEGGKTLSTKMRFQRLSFSQFAQFVDYWDPMVSIHDDEFDGRFHTNSDFNLSGRDGVHPRFRGKVTTTGYRIRSATGFPFLNTDSVFLAGIETGVDIIHFPGAFDQWIDRLAQVDSLCRVFDEETWITFLRDGRFCYRTRSTPSLQYVRLPREQSFAILGRKKGRLHVKGVVAGKVLVVSRDRIIIDDDLVYRRHPAVVPDSPDYLGLVSEHDVVIAHPRVTGPGDLHIQAAILAKGYFRVPNLYGHGHAVLYIYGSLSAGSLTATEPRYATRVRFDRRLEKKRPPRFPMTDRYELKDWDGRWLIKSN